MYKIEFLELSGSFCNRLLFSVQFYCINFAGLDGRLGQSRGDSGHWCYKQT